VGTWELLVLVVVVFDVGRHSPKNKWGRNTKTPNAAVMDFKIQTGNPKQTMQPT
jgi:hypothetical protein